MSSDSCRNTSCPFLSVSSCTKTVTTDNSMSHNSSQDSMSYHMTSMFHETLEKQDAKLYEYLLEDDTDDGIGSLPELESSTAASFLMEDDSRKSFTTTSDNMSRDRFGWTTPIVAKQRRSDSNSLHPYLVHHTRDSRQQRTSQSLQQQLQLAHNELARVRHTNSLLKASLVEKEEQLHQLIVKLRQRDEELEAKEIELDRMTLELETKEIQLDYNVRMELLHCQQTTTNATMAQQQQDENDVVADDEQLQAKILKCEEELQQLGVILCTNEYSTGIPQNNNNNHNIPHDVIPRQIYMTQQQPPLMLHHSMLLAQSLIGLIQNDDDDNDDKETKVMDRLWQMSELLDSQEETISSIHDYNCGGGGGGLVPLTWYERLQQKCHVLEMERHQVLTTTLDLMESARQANAMELEIHLKEMKERYQKQVEECVSAILSTTKID